MIEKSVENTIKSYLRTKGAYFFKVHGSEFMPKGLPDIVACYRGYFIGIEVKRPGRIKDIENDGRSLAQKTTEKAILQANGKYLLTDNTTDIIEFLEKIDNEYNTNR